MLIGSILVSECRPLANEGTVDYAGWRVNCWDIKTPVAERSRRQRAAHSLFTATLSEGSRTTNMNVVMGLLEVEPVVEGLDSV